MTYDCANTSPRGPENEVVILDGTLPREAKTEDKHQVAEHRGEVRHLSRHRPTIRLLARPGLQRLKGVVRDVSTSGIGLELNQPLEPGTILVLELQGRHVGVSRIQSAVVMNASPLGGDTWLIGCKMKIPFSDFDLQCLLWEG
jgi:hypothetical protein